MLFTSGGDVVCEQEAWKSESGQETLAFLIPTFSQLPRGAINTTLETTQLLSINVPDKLLFNKGQIIKKKIQIHF